MSSGSGVAANCLARVLDKLGRRVEARQLHTRTEHL